MSNSNAEMHHRKSYRLQGYDYSQPGWYFITICLKSIACMFAVQQNKYLQFTPVGEIAQQFWKEIPNHFPHVRLDEYVFMPDHVHGIIVIKKQHDNNAGAFHDNHVGTFHDDGQSIHNVGTFHETSLHYSHHNKKHETTTPATTETPTNHTTHDDTQNIAHNKTIKQRMSSISPKRGSLPVIIRSYTSSVKRWCNKNGYRQFQWQSRYYDHIIRNKKDLYVIRKYIRNNPGKLFERVKNNMEW